MILNKRLEDVFAHAVALQQSGRLRSTVYCIGRNVYILNQDYTVLLRFQLRRVDKLEFESPVSFVANDYDSNNVAEREGGICFIQSGAGFDRVKSCKAPKLSPEDVEALFGKYALQEVNQVTLHKDMLGLLDPSLSHVEFSAADGKLSIIQRNIYSGSVLELKRSEAGGLGIQQADKLEDFAPIGLRTNDFMALFSFVDTFNFHFQPGGLVWAESKDPRMLLRALISKCKYDELGGIDSGREEQEIGTHRGNRP